jgi:acetyl-CoA carboxylase biotin carboxyl carrier protein
VPVDRDRILQVIETLKSTDAGELTIREGEVGIRVRRADVGAADSDIEAVNLDGTPLSALDRDTAEAALAAEEANLAEVRTHLVGFFHYAKTPGDPPLVQVGDSVREGQVVGTIEALRMLTDLVSPVAGEVASVNVEDGHAVQYGDVLMRIRPTNGGVNGSGTA